MALLVRLLLVMLPIILLATPAASAVERFTDLKGTIHITNRARQLQNQENERKDEAPTAILQPSLENQDPTGKPIKFLDAQGTIHLRNAPAKEPEILQAAEPCPETIPSGSLTDPPVQPVLFSERKSPIHDNPGWPDEVETSTAVGFEVASNRPNTGTVRKFRDRDGVIHINNGKPESGRLMMAGGFAPPQMPKDEWPGRKPPAESGKDPKGLIKPASLLLPPVPTLAQAAPAPQLPGGSSFSHGVTGVRRYRDDQGVIHLVSSPRPLLEDRGPPGCWGPWPAGIPPGDMRPMAKAPEIASLSLRKDRQGTLHLTNDTGASDLRQSRGKDLKAILAEASFCYGLPLPLIEALIKVESNFATSALSPKGAMGLMQLMPGTARDMGVEDPFCPRENVLGGCRYLRILLDACQSLPLALAAYNAGYRRVVDSGFKVPDIKETQAFVTQVLGHYYLAQKKKSQGATYLRL